METIVQRVGERLDKHRPVFVEGSFPNGVDVLALGASEFGKDYLYVLDVCNVMVWSGPVGTQWCSQNVTKEIAADTIMRLGMKSQ